MRSSVDRGLNLYGHQGDRKYLNQVERRRVLEAFGRLEPTKELFALTLAWTGARISEVLDLRVHSFQIEECRVAIRTLKRRRLVVREVPVPRELMESLDRYFKLRERQRDPERTGDRLWIFCRVTGWRFMRNVMRGAGVVGAAGCPKGLRHGFAVGALQAGVPLNVVQRWLGHARISTTSIYANVSGAEEREFAARFWRLGQSWPRPRDGDVMDLQKAWYWMLERLRRLVGLPHPRAAHERMHR